MIYLSWRTDLLSGLLVSDKNKNIYGIKNIYRFKNNIIILNSIYETTINPVVLLIAWTHSIKGSLCIWYSLQISLRLRGVTPTNRHPLQSCGFSREILWHSSLEVVMNLTSKYTLFLMNYIPIHIWKDLICGFVGDVGVNCQHRQKI